MHLISLSHRMLIDSDVLFVQIVVVVPGTGGTRCMVQVPPVSGTKTIL